MARTTYLKIGRLKRGVTQECAGVEVGISRQLYNLIENGKLEPSASVKIKLIQIYNKPITKLLREV